MTKLNDTLTDLERLEREATPGPWTWIADDPKREWERVEAADREDLQPWLASGDPHLGPTWLASPGAIIPKPIRRDPAMVLDYADCGSHACASKPVDRKLITASRNALPTLLALARLAVEARALVYGSDDECGSVAGDRWRERINAVVAEVERGVKR